MQERNFYEILQIDSRAESKAIHTAYKRLSKEYQNNEFTLYEYILKMQELNKAYLTLINDETRVEYDEDFDEIPNKDVPFEIDKESARKNGVKIKSCNFYVDDGEVKGIGEIISVDKSPIKNFMEIHFSVYDSNSNLIGTKNSFGNKAGNRMTFDEYIDLKPESAIPANVKIFFVE